MMKNKTFLFSFIILCLSACKDKEIPLGKDDPINITPTVCTVSAAGGVFLTFPADQSFMLSGSHRKELSNEDPGYVYYQANDARNFLQSEFFSVEVPNDRRLNFFVEPNTTKEERSHTVIINSGDRWEYITLTQTAN